MLHSYCTNLLEKTDNPEERGEHVKRRLVPAAGLVSGDHLDDVEVLDSDSEIDSNMDNEQLEWESMLRPFACAHLFVCLLVAGIWVLLVTQYWTLTDRQTVHSCM